jgi:hypothetical protein
MAPPASKTPAHSSNDLVEDPVMGKSEAASGATDSGTVVVTAVVVDIPATTVDVVVDVVTAAAAETPASMVEAVTTVVEVGVVVVVVAIDEVDVVEVDDVVGTDGKPRRSNFHTNTSVAPEDVTFAVSLLGSKSDVPLKEPAT